MKQFLIFGDSLVYGAWDIEGGWVARFRKDFDKQAVDSKLNNVTLVFNLGINGETSTGLLARFENEIKERVSEGEDNAIVISVGINDSELYLEKNTTATSTEKFKSNLAQLLKIGQKYTPKVVFIGLPPVNQKLVDPIPWSPERAYRNDLITQFDEIIKAMCEQEQVTFIDLQKKLKPDYLTNLLDGTHPNSVGHQQIYEVVKEELVNL